MKILVTGATGFLGSRTVELLARQPEVSHILATGRNKTYQPDFHSDKVRYLFGDLSDGRFVDGLFQKGMDYVVNCASLSSPWGPYETFYHCNVLSQENLVRTSINHGVNRFVYISSPSIYFDFKDHVLLSEADPIPSQPVNHYAKTKLMAEKLLKDSGLKYIILRPRALIGRGDTVIMPRLIRSYKEGRLRILGDGQNEVDLTSVENMARAVWLALTTDQDNCQTDYNISNGEPVKLWEAINDILQQLGMEPVSKKVPYSMLMIIARILEWRAKYIHGSHEPTLTRYSVGVLARTFTCDITKAREKLGYEPQQSIIEAQKEFVQWYKEQHHEG